MYTCMYVCLSVCVLVCVSVSCDKYVGIRNCEYFKLKHTMSKSLLKL